MAKLIKANGSITEIQPENGTDFTAQELSSYVGGYIESVYLCTEPPQRLIVNENGKVIGLPFNPKATALTQQPNTNPRYCWKTISGLSLDDYIVGDAVLLDESEII